MLIDFFNMPTTTPILTEIFGSANYVVGGAGGDMGEAFKQTQLDVMGEKAAREYLARL